MDKIIGYKCNWVCGDVLGHMQKKKTNTLTMMSDDRHNITKIVFTSGLIRLDRQSNRTRLQTTDKSETEKSPRLASANWRISATAHCTHLIINRTKNISWN